MLKLNRSKQEVISPERSKKGLLAFRNSNGPSFIETKFCDKNSNKTSDNIWTHFGLCLKQHKYNDVSIYVVSLYTHIAENECM